MNIAIIFFGIARSLPVSIDSIRQNIYAANADSGLNLTTFVSVNLVDEVHNPSNDEFAVRLDHADCFQISADHYILRRQNDAEIAPYLDHARRQSDAFGNNWISTRNMLHQLGSLRAGWRSIPALTDTVFDAYLFLRPDQLYLDEISIAPLLARFQGTRNILLPGWHSWSGLNDRMALADPIAARCYAERILLVEEFCRTRPLHAETLLAYAIAKGGCKVGELPVRAKRLRANGAIVEEGFDTARIPMPEVPGPVELWNGPVAGISIHQPQPGIRHWTPPAAAEVVPVAEPAIGDQSQVIRLHREQIGAHTRATPLGGRYYIDRMKQFHYDRRVTRYLEIGVSDGQSLRLAQRRAIGIDPANRLEPGFAEQHPDATLFHLTSDDYFAAHDPKEILGGPIELAFIDGMHQCEYVLRDFINVERHCAPDGMILIHDVLPQNFEMTEREHRQPERKDTEYSYNWTGDVWRVLDVLAAVRPDLRIDILDCPPTGLAVITNLDPQSHRLQDMAQSLTDDLLSQHPDEEAFWRFMQSVRVLDSSRFLD